MIVKAKPDLETTNIPSNKFRKKFHEFITGINDRQKPGEERPTNYFEIFIMSCIVLNMVQMCLIYDGAPSAYT